MRLLSFQAHNQPRAGSVVIILIVQKGETEEQRGEVFAQSLKLEVASSLYGFRKEGPLEWVLGKQSKDKLALLGKSKASWRRGHSVWGLKVE